MDTITGIHRIAIEMPSTPRTAAGECAATSGGPRPARQTPAQARTGRTGWTKGESIMESRAAVIVRETHLDRTGEDLSASSAARGETTASSPEIDRFTPYIRYFGPDRQPDLIGYWRSMKPIRGLPTLDLLDRNKVAEHWPRTVLLSCYWAAHLLRLDLVYSRMWLDGERPDLSDQECSHLLEWLLDLSRGAALAGDAMTGVGFFGAEARTIRIRATALPFTNGGGDERTDHVLSAITILR